MKTYYVTVTRILLQLSELDIQAKNAADARQQAKDKLLTVPDDDWETLWSDLHDVYEVNELVKVA